jgi:beta-phosphoglucomutase-like phosphatase (HAD superfamily)
MTGSTMLAIDVERYEALIFDLDGVITQTASLHAQAWKQLFDEFLAKRAAKTRAAFVPFDPESDYRHYVDGKPPIEGVLSFLAGRGVDLPIGTPQDVADQRTAHALASREDHYFGELLAREGVKVFASAATLLHEARRQRGMRTAVASSSHHCEEILRAADLTALSMFVSTGSILTSSV